MKVTTEEELRQAMLIPSETETLEFKRAAHRYDFDKLAKYCVALANEGGGSIVLGVTNDLPREIVGTEAFDEIERTKQGLFEKLRWRISVFEIITSQGRVVSFYAPGRPKGHPLMIEGTAYMRVGESLVPMSVDQISSILEERTPDYSAELVPNSTFDLLSPEAVQEFRNRWAKKSGYSEIMQWSDTELLENSELTVDGELTYAAIALMGKRTALSKHLAQAELIFEYRSSPASIEYQQRKEYREGFLLWFDDLWETINLRNEVQQFQSGLLRYDIPTFDERSVREAVLNGICHRDYREGGSVWVRQFPRMLEIESPGGFPKGVTADNILIRQYPRNRRLTEALARCGFVERSGQGADLMFRQSIRQSKPLPDYSESDSHRVFLRMKGDIQDPRFLRFLEEVGEATLRLFSTSDFLLLDCIHKEEKVPQNLENRIPSLLEAGVIERVGRKKFILSRDFYEFLDNPGTYTHKKGLEKETEKALLLKHIEDYDKDGAPMKDLMEVLPSKSRIQISRLLNELREEQKVHLIGKTSAARWHYGPRSDVSNSDVNTK